MAIAVVQKANNSSTEAYAGAAASLTVYFTAQFTTPLNAIVVGAGGYDNGGPSQPNFSDNKSNTYVPIGYVVASGTVYTANAYCLGITGGSNHSVTITATSGNNDLEMTAFEVSGIGAYEDEDHTQSYSLTSDDGDFLLFHVDDGSSTPSITWTGSTAQSSSSYGRCATKVVVTGGTEAPTEGGDTACLMRFSAASDSATGTLAVTLGDAILSAAGDVDTEGTLAGTLGAATLSAVGTVLAVGTLAATLSAATVSATGEHTPVEGTLAVPLDAAIVSAAGDVDVDGSLSETLGVLTLSASGLVEDDTREGTLDVTLDAATLSSAAELDVDGDLSVTLEAATVAATGIHASVEGTLAETLDEATVGASGLVEVDGSLTETLGEATVAATGIHAPASGTLSVTLDAATVSAAGIHAPVDGTLAETLGTLTASGAGEVDIEGTATPTLGDATTTTAGEVDIDADLAVTLGTLTLEAYAFLGTPPITGILAVTLDAATLSAAAESTMEGTFNVTLEAATVSAAGIHAPASGTLDVTLGTLTAAGLGVVPAAGTLAATLGEATAAGLGEIDIEGTLAETLGELTCFGSTSSTSLGTLAVTLDDAVGLLGTEWTDLVDVSVDGNTITKTGGGSAFNAGAFGVRPVGAGGWIRRVVDVAANVNLMWGLSHENNGQNYTTIDYTVYTHSASQTYLLYSSNSPGAVFSSGITYQDGDVIEIRPAADSVQFWLNGAFVWDWSSHPTFWTPPEFPLYVDTSVWLVGGTCTSWESGGAGAGDVLVDGTADATLEALTASGAAEVAEHIVWTNLVNCSESDGVLTKTSGGSAYNAGAASTHGINGDGYAEFTIPPETVRHFVGLTSGDEDAGFDPHLDFCVFVYFGQLSVYEAGTFRGQFDTYVPGDKVRIASSGGTVYYSKNGTNFYTSGVSPDALLRADTSIYYDDGECGPGVLGGTNIVDWPATEGAAAVTLEALAATGAAKNLVDGELVEILAALTLSAEGREDQWWPRATLEDEYLTDLTPSEAQGIIAPSEGLSLMSGSETLTEVSEVLAQWVPSLNGWDFEGNLDEHRNDVLDLSIEAGSPSFVTGKDGQALQLNAKFDSVGSTPANGDLLDSGESFSIAAWLRKGHPLDRFWIQAVVGTINYWRLDVSTTAALVFYLEPYPQAEVAAPAIPDDGEWYFVCGVYDHEAGGEASIWTDTSGVLTKYVGNALIRTDLGVSDSVRLRCIAVNNNAGGGIDRLRIFSSALTAAEVAAVYDEVS